MNNSSPFGQSLQGSRSFQNNTQSAPQQMFGGFQPQQSFGGFGSGQGFGGFNPFQGGYGGGFQPQGFGGGVNPMFGGIGGLGFNPMMGPQFMQPMQKFDPYQQQMRRHQQFLEQRDQSLAPTWQAAQQARQQNPAYAQLQQLQSQFRDKNPNFEELKQINDLQNQIDSDPALIKAKNAHENAVQQFQAQRQQPMFGGIGGLGLNPMMGGQFMQPMQKFAPYQQSQQPQDFGSLDMRYRGGPQMSPEMRLRREQDMRALESQANASLTGATGASNPGMMALQQAALRNASPQKLATPVENRYSLPSNNWWETLDA